MGDFFSYLKWGAAESAAPPLMSSKVVWLLAIACSVVSVTNIPPEACALSVCSLQFGMLLEELVL